MIVLSLGTLYVIQAAPPLLNKVPLPSRVLLFGSMLADFAFRVITRGGSVVSSLAPVFPSYALHWVGGGAACKTVYPLAHHNIIVLRKKAILCNRLLC